MEEPYTVKGDCLIIHFKEELDHHLTEQLRGVIDSIIEKCGIRYIVMDFENLPAGQAYDDDFYIKVKNLTVHFKLTQVDRSPDDWGNGGTQEDEL